MNLEGRQIYCPYCAELIEVLLEPCHEIQQYYEDCQVCCQPILIRVSPDETGGHRLIDCCRADEIL